MILFEMFISTKYECFMHELPRQMKTPAKFRKVLSNNDVLFDFSEIANFFID